MLIRSGEYIYGYSPGRINLVNTELELSVEAIYTSIISVVASELLKVLLKNGRGKEEKPLQKEKKIWRICWGSKTSYE